MLPSQVKKPPGSRENEVNNGMFEACLIGRLEALTGLILYISSKQEHADPRQRYQPYQILHIEEKYGFTHLYIKHAIKLPSVASEKAIFTVCASGQD